jgi:uncharacterized BrkB/YihY/UPF0761 family membrane protein
MEHSTQRKRKHLLTAFLIFGILSNAFSILTYTVFQSKVLEMSPDVAPWTLVAMALISVANVVFNLALLSWKKWGFWGACASAVLAFLVNISWSSNPRVAVGLLGPLVLYALLQHGKDQKAWPKLT